MLIRISGRTAVTDKDGEPVAAEAAYRELDGAVSAEACSDFLSSDLADLDITGGTVKLKWEPGTGELRVVTEYVAPRKLRPAELKRLVEETNGQWSDGIGEGCFDELAERLGVTIDLTPYDRPADLRVEQVSDGWKVRPPKTALVKAARDGDLDAVRQQLDQGADTEVRLQGYTALSMAVLYGHADIALELIRRGADVHTQDPAGADPLLTTATSNSISDADAARVARALLERGVGTHVRRMKPGWGGEYTPLFMAENRKKAALAAVLREFGAVE